MVRSLNINHFIEVRKKAGLSQGELAQDICTQATLSRFERGGKIPSVKILTQLCNRLGISIDELFRTVPELRSKLINDKLRQAEFNLIISEYANAADIIDKLQLTDNEGKNYRKRIDYIKGYVSILSGQDIQKTIDRYHAELLNTNDLKNIYSLLTYCGLGMGYARIGKNALAEQYFEFVFRNIFDFQAKNANETWKILTILFYTAEFYSKTNLSISNHLLETIVNICSNEHMTFYLARSVLLLAENEYSGGRDSLKIANYLIDAHAYAKINNNQIELNQIRYFAKKWHIDDLPITIIFND